MTLTSLTRILWREFWSVLPALIVAGLLCVAVVVSSPPTYQATGSVVLLNPPALPQTQIGGPPIPENWQNPFARIGSLAVVVDLMVRVMGSDPVSPRLLAAGFEGTADIAGNRDYYNGPIVDLAVTAPTAAKAIADVNLLTQEFNTQLDQIQEQQGTVPEYRIRAEPVVSAREATKVLSKTIRKLILALGLGAILVVGTALMSDRLRSRRGRRNPVEPSSDEATSLGFDIRQTIDDDAGVSANVEIRDLASVGDRRRSRD